MTKSNYILLLALASIAIIILLYYLIYLNRANDSTISLGLKVFGPILIAMFLLGWDLFGSKVSKKDQIELNIFSSIEDANPYNLGKAYYNTYNKGIGYSELTNTYRISNIRDVFNDRIENSLSTLTDGEPPLNSSTIESLRKTSKITHTSRVNFDLIYATYINWLANVYKFDWTVDYKQAARFGGGQISYEHSESPKNSYNFKVDEIIKHLLFSIDRTNSTQSDIINLPKSGKFHKLEKGIDKNGNFLKSKYSSKNIKFFNIEIRYKGYSRLRRGRMVDALNNHLDDMSKTYAFHYDVKFEYSTYYLNKWSPQTKAEIEWIENQIEHFKTHYDWNIIEEKMITSLNFVDKDLNLLIE